MADNFGVRCNKLPLWAFIGLFKQQRMSKEEDIVSPEVVEAMGITMPAFEEIQAIIGRMPTVAELSSLLAMWDANGRQQSLYGWLRGQHHTVEKNDYLYDGSCHDHRGLREPKVKDCLAIVQTVDFYNPAPHEPLSTSKNLYLVGDISSEFVSSEYAEHYLHLVPEPIALPTADEAMEYMTMILEALREAAIVTTVQAVERGGVFGCLLSSCGSGGVGFDILTCREVRLDAFLFGEESGRMIVSLSEEHDDIFLQKLTEAHLNCCFLGRTTKGRIVVDGMDFGISEAYIAKK